MDARFDFIALRTQPEKVLKGHRVREANADVVHLIHEFEIHQVELKPQSNELIHTQKAPEDSRNERLSFHDSSPIAFVKLSAKRIVLRSNRTAGDMLASPGGNLTVRDLSQFIHPENHAIFFACLRKSPEFIGMHTCEVCSTGKRL